MLPYEAMAEIKRRYEQFGDCRLCGNTGICPAFPGPCPVCQRESALRFARWVVAPMMVASAVLGIAVVVYAIGRLF